MMKRIIERLKQETLLTLKEVSESFVWLFQLIVRLWKRYHVKAAGYATLVVMAYLFIPVIIEGQRVYWEAAKEEGRQESFRYHYKYAYFSGGDLKMNESEKEYYKIFGTEKPQDLTSYFRRDEWLTTRYRISEKYVNDNSSPMGGPYTVEIEMHKLPRIQEELLKYAKEKWGVAAVYEQREVYKQTEMGRWHTRPAKFDLAYLLLLLLIWLGKAMLASNLYFIPLLKSKGFSLKWEIVTGRLFAANLLFFIAHKFYPNGDPRENLRRYLRVWANVIGFALITAASAGATMAKATDSKKKSKQSYALFEKRRTQDAPPKTDPPSPDDNDNIEPPSASLGRTSWRDRWSATVWGELASEYLGGNGIVFNDRPVLQSGATVMHKPTGLYFDEFNSRALDHGNGLENEFDAKVGINRNIQNFNVDVGLAHVAVTPLGKIRGDVLMLTAKVARSFKLSDRHSLTPQYAFWKAWPMKGGSPRGGKFSRFGLGHSWKLTERFGVGNFAEVVRDHDGAFDAKKGWFAKWSHQLNIKLSKRLTLMAPILRMSAPINVSDRKKEAIFGIGFAWNL